MIISSVKQKIFKTILSQSKKKFIRYIQYNLGSIKAMGK